VEEPQFCPATAGLFPGRHRSLHGGTKHGPASITERELRFAIQLVANYSRAPLFTSRTRTLCNDRRAFWDQTQLTGSNLRLPSNIATRAIRLDSDPLTGKRWEIPHSALFPERKPKMTIARKMRLGTQLHGLTWRVMTRPDGEQLVASPRGNASPSLGTKKPRC
jgi:hypothetical protein